MSQRSPFTPSGIVSRGLYLAAKHSPKGLNVIMAAGYGICEVLGISMLASTLWPFLQSTLKERFNATKGTASDKQGPTSGIKETKDGNIR